MKKKTIYMPVVLIIGTLWLIVTIWCWVGSSQDISLSERRKLAQFPVVSVDSILSGKFMSGFEKYTLDQFPLRDSFRTLKAVSSFFVFSQKDNNDIYIADGYAAKLEYPLNEGSVTSAADKFQYLYNTYMKEKNMHVYLSIVPDKGYFLAENSGYPSMDYDRLFALIQANMPFAKYIDITGCLELSDYYKADPHWKQEEIVDVAGKLAEYMGMKGLISGNYSKITADLPFYGAYYGQSALPLKSETITYLTNRILDSCRVYNAETNETGGIYNMDKLQRRDPYEMFLSGASPILYIENPNAVSDRELIVFRDSFGSSLIPLLAEGYTKVTLVDTRYISSNYVGDYVTFENQDVLFLYSTLVLNNSMVLK